MKRKKKALKKKLRKQTKVDLLLQSKQPQTRKTLKKFGGVLCGSSEFGPLYWFRDRSVACLLPQGKVAKVL